MFSYRKSEEFPPTANGPSFICTLIRRTHLMFASHSKRSRPRKIASLIAAVALSLNATNLISQSVQADEPKPIKIGVIGLDTSHAPAFAKVFNAKDAVGEFASQEITHAYAGGSDDLESSYSRLPEYVKQFETMGIELVDSVDELVKHVDVVIIHSLDGRKHLEQVAPVFKAGKPVYLDKPLAGTLSQAIAIQKLGEKYQVPWFTSSSLRFGPDTIRFREDDAIRSTIRGAIAWSPCSLEKTHPDFYWYGVHGVETLYTAMGPGCQEVTRVSTDGTDVAVGVWEGGRVGEFRGLRDGKADYGMLVFRNGSIDTTGKFEGYEPLIVRVADFFRGKYSGVDTKESVEMFAFMEAADESKRQGGKPVSISDVMSKASKEADVLVEKYSK